MSAAHLLAPTATDTAFLDYAAACHGKIGFESPLLAVKVAQRKTDKVNGIRHPYRCPKCGLWHLGRQIAYHKLPPPKSRMEFIRKEL